MSFDKCTAYIQEGLKSTEDKRYAEIIMYLWLNIIKPVMQSGLDASIPRNNQKKINFEEKDVKCYEKKRDISEFKGRPSTDYYQKILDVKRKSGKSVFNIYELAEICDFRDIRNAGKDYYSFKSMIEAFCIDEERVNHNGKAFSMYRF